MIQLIHVWLWFTITCLEEIINHSVLIYSLKALPSCSKYLSRKNRKVTLIFILWIFRGNQISIQAGGFDAVYSIEPIKAEWRGSRAYFTIDFDHERSIWVVFVVVDKMLQTVMNDHYGKWERYRQNNGTFQIYFQWTWSLFTLMSLSIHSNLLSNYQKM